MILPWRKRRSNKKSHLEFNSEIELIIPTHFRCPISLDLMKDPVTLSTGITYDRESIEKWVESGSQTCPITNQTLKIFDQIPNHTLRKMIQDWCVENKTCGVERIPTPKIPVTHYHVSGILSRITTETQQGDEKKCREYVRKIKRLTKESERNKKCIVENGAGYVFSAAFESFASVSPEKHRFLLEEILSMLILMFPLGVEGQSKMGSAESLRCIAWLLHGSDLSPKQNAVIALKELLSLDENHVHTLKNIEGVCESLFKFVKEPICPKATKAALMVIYCLISQPMTDEKMASRFVEMGLVPLLLEILVGSDRSLCEKALGVLDVICGGSEEVREKVRGHALAVPVLVKKILRVSTVATEFSVSALWKLCKNESAGGGGAAAAAAMVEALQLGGFQKVLVVLQVGCGERTKMRATELLKLMSNYRGRLDCFDSSMDFKHLKRPY